jgi:4-hydroxythreonine-4-phosphate dehydrogenase
VRSVAKKSNIPVIALTPGEPAGVGPDLAIQLAQQPPAGALVLIADPALLAERAKLLHLPFAAREWKGRESAGQGVYLLPVKTACPVTAGRLDTANAVYVIETLKSAVAGCTGGEFDALVTGPVHKGIINDAGIAFTGHTEFLAEASGAAQPVMLLAAPGPARGAGDDAPAARRSPARDHAVAPDGGDRSAARGPPT